jgi:alkanesulfonate monooxygenase SsuD/methylene tetrahydromethanopterin reductase-like flavin-dependent oxidoreductase (luciferase family)
MQIGIDSFAAAISDPATGLTLSPVERMHHLLEEIELADKVGLDLFGIGEHHRAEFLDSAPVVILSAAATRTENIRLTMLGSGSPRCTMLAAPPLSCCKQTAEN